MTQPSHESDLQTLAPYRIAIRRFVLRHNNEPVMRLELSTGGRMELVIFVCSPGTANQRVSGYAALWNPAFKHSNLAFDIAPYALPLILKTLLGPLDFAAARAIQAARAA